MKEINFFEQYLKDSNQTKQKRYRYVAISAIIVASILAYPIYSYAKISNYQSRMESAEEYLRNSENSKMIEKVRAIDESIASLGQQRQKLADVTKYLLENDCDIDDSLITAITNTIPRNIDIQVIDVEDKVISIMGSSLDKDSISVFQKNLRESSNFVNVFIPNIIHESQYYDFNILFEITENGDVKGN
ncbi:MAG: PilN domain-containing protein [Firmicutes bacterium]|jgi:Tfp pilus assembly protein PilN|nr:PilN domain-containing protein [Bacillota bacterium]